MLTPGLLQQIVAKAETLGLSETAIATLRRQWPGLSFTWCSENDIPARLRPQAAGTTFDLYLVSGAEHCVAFTDALEAASGVVLASRDEDG
jgi:hypothetical protein